MRWRVEFYSKRRGIVAGYDVDAPLPDAAVRQGRAAVLAEHPSRAHGRLSLLDRAERAGGEDGSGWILHRILRSGGTPPDGGPARDSQ